MGQEAITLDGVYDWPQNRRFGEASGTYATKTDLSKPPGVLAWFYNLLIGKQILYLVDQIIRSRSSFVRCVASYCFRHCILLARKIWPPTSFWRLICI